ncbi:MAG: carotenoid oxygenase family protein, partial [Cyanobacteria bacterium CAN_BIN43]|nr:carotenoid oxygenase family protein [Cyanobacteria bacterium CAN_BIN43]
SNAAVNSENEDDGWVLVLAFNGESERSELVILNGKDLSEVARLKLKHHVPYGLHGQFTPRYYESV